MDWKIWKTRGGGRIYISNKPPYLCNIVIKNCIWKKFRGAPGAPPSKSALDVGSTNGWFTGARCWEMRLCYRVGSFWTHTKDISWAVPMKVSSDEWHHATPPPPPPPPGNSSTLIQVMTWSRQPTLTQIYVAKWHSLEAAKSVSVSKSGLSD